MKAALETVQVARGVDGVDVTRQRPGEGQKVGVGLEHVGVGRDGADAHAALVLVAGRRRASNVAELGRADVLHGGGGREVVGSYWRRGDMSKGASVRW